MNARLYAGLGWFVCEWATLDNGLIDWLAQLQTHKIGEVRKPSRSFARKIDTLTELILPYPNDSIKGRYEEATAIIDKYKPFRDGIAHGGAMFGLGFIDHSIDEDDRMIPRVRLSIPNDKYHFELAQGQTTERYYNLFLTADELETAASELISVRYSLDRIVNECLPAK